MNFTAVDLDCDRITNWNTFHNVFADVFGFPEFYGMNMNAWIDCMTSLDSPDDAMTSVHTPAGGVVVLTLKNFNLLAKRQPELYEAIVESTAFVNHRKIESNESPVLVLSSSG